MNELRPRPEGVMRLFGYILLAAVVLMILPYALRGLASALKILDAPPPAPVDNDFIRLLVWAVVAGLLIGIAIRLARKI